MHRCGKSPSRCKWPCPTNIICDPSHIAGKRALLERVAQKAADLGMHGLMMESYQPEAAMSDSDGRSPPLSSSVDAGLTIRDAHTGPSDPANLEALRLQMDSLTNKSSSCSKRA